MYDKSISIIVNVNVLELMFLDLNVYFLKIKCVLESNFTALSTEKCTLPHPTGKKLLE